MLLERLIAWLAAQHAFVRRFRLLMHHEPRWQSDRTPQATALEIALAEPSRDSAHLLVLLREQLARLRLPAPTLELRLQAEDISRRAPPNAELFATAQERARRPDPPDRAAAGAARPGPGAAPGGDRRPSAGAGQRPVRGAGDRCRFVGGRSWRQEAPAQRLAVAAVAAGREAPPSSAAAAARPVWLQAAEPLPERAARPLLDGRPLQLLAGPERIEAGWWDAGLAGRDYFIAATAEGALVWIYRERLPLSRSAGEEEDGDERLVPAGTVRLTHPHPDPLASGRGRLALQRRSSPTSVKPRRRSESPSQRLPLTPQNSM